MIPARTWPALSPTDQARLATLRSILVLTQCEGFTRQQALRLCFHRALAVAGLYQDDQAPAEVPNG